MRRFWTSIAAVTIAVLTFSTGSAQASPTPRPASVCIASLASWNGHYLVTADQARNTCDKLIVTQAQATQVQTYQNAKGHAATLKVWNWLGDGHKISAAGKVRAAVCTTYLTLALKHEVSKKTARKQCNSMIVHPDESRVTYRFEKKHPKAFKIWKFNPKH